MKKPDPKVDPSPTALSAAELEKLTLEIAELKYKNSWANRFAMYTPVLTASIAVFGFLFGIYQFQRQQRTQTDQMLTEQKKDRQSRDREHDIRIQNQIRSDVESLLQFTNHKEITVSQVLFYLKDIERNLDLSTDVNVKNLKRGITVTLLASVVDDCDFDQHRDVNFAFALLANWEDYGSFLKENPDKLAFILGKYIESLQSIAEKYPVVVGKVEVEDDLTFSYPAGAPFGGEPMFHFQDIIMGFEHHLDLVGIQGTKEEFIKRFQTSTCNPELTEQYLGVKFTQDPNFLSRCG